MDATDNNPDARADDLVADTAPAAPGTIAEPEVAETQSTDPIRNEEGFALIVTENGTYPANHRLRAEAMARDGVTTDADGMISDELIASTKDRLAREDAEAKANTPSMDWTRDRLVEFAARTPGAFHETDANKRAILDAINAATAAPSES